MLEIVNRHTLSRYTSDSQCASKWNWSWCVLWDYVPWFNGRHRNYSWILMTSSGAILATTCAQLKQLIPTDKTKSLFCSFSTIKVYSLPQSNEKDHPQGQNFKTWHVWSKGQTYCWVLNIDLVAIKQQTEKTKLILYTNQAHKLTFVPGIAPWINTNKYKTHEDVFQ
jgi:hypothetical protein